MIPSPGDTLPVPAPMSLPRSGAGLYWGLQGCHSREACLGTAELGGGTGDTKQKRDTEMRSLAGVLPFMELPPSPSLSLPFCPLPLGLSLPHTHPIFKWRLLRSGQGTRGGREYLKYAADPKHNKYLILFY